MAIGVANVTANQAAQYYEEDDYYEQEQPQNGEKRLLPYWQGKGAERLGLVGRIDAEEFRQVLGGYSLEGQRLHAQPINPQIHRAGTDYTFSAPKSISVAALVQKDTRLIAAHDQAVKAALSVLENRYLEVRVRNAKTGRRDRICTGNLTAAIFPHQSSRNHDPHLHHHAVVLNATEYNRRWRAVANERAVQNQKLLDQVYLNELAYLSQQLGYGIELRSQARFELKGYASDALKAFSSRRQEIESFVSQSGEPESGKLFQRATIQTRAPKKALGEVEQRERWKTVVEQQQLQFPALPVQSQMQHIKPDQTVAIVNQHIQRLIEQDGAFEREDLEQSILECSVGQFSFAKISQAIDNSPELVRYGNWLTNRDQLDRLNQLEKLFGLSHAQNQVRTAEETRGTVQAISKRDFSRSFGSSIGERVAAALSRNSRSENDDLERITAGELPLVRARSSAFQIDRCLEQIGLANSTPTIDVAAVVRDVEAIRNRQTLDWSGNEIAAAVTAIADNLRGLEQVSGELDRLAKAFERRVTEQQEQARQAGRDRAEWLLEQAKLYYGTEYWQQQIQPTLSFGDRKWVSEQFTEWQMQNWGEQNAGQEPAPSAQTRFEWLVEQFEQYWGTEYWQQQVQPSLSWGERRAVEQWLAAWEQQFPPEPQPLPQSAINPRPAWGLEALSQSMAELQQASQIEDPQPQVEQEFTEEFQPFVQQIEPEPAPEPNPLNTQWLDEVFPAAIEVMQVLQHEESRTRQLEDGRLQIQGRNYWGEWDRNEKRLDYFDPADGRLLFSAQQTDKRSNTWDLLKVGEVRLADVHTHQQMKLVLEQGRQQQQEQRRDQEWER